MDNNNCGMTFYASLRIADCITIGSTWHNNTSQDLIITSQPVTISGYPNIGLQDFPGSSRPIRFLQRFTEKLSLANALWRIEHSLEH